MSQTIVVRELDEKASGTSASGKPWTIYAVIAEDPAGNILPGKLRTFDGNLPLDEPIEVELEERVHPQYGSEYTIRRVKPSLRTGGGEQVSADLDRRVRDLEQRVASLEAGRIGF